MTTHSWLTLSEDDIDANPFWTHSRRRFRTPEGREGDYHYMRNDGAVIVYARDEDGRFVMVREYRYLFERVSLSSCMGGVEPGESMDAAAARELREETGCEPGTIVRIGTVATAPAFSQEEFGVYFADRVRTVGDHDHEILEVVRMDADQIEEAIRTGGMWDSNVVCGWHLVRLHLAAASRSLGS